MTGGHAIVTGGSSGIGLAIARRLAADGWAISLLARDPERLDRARRSLLECGASGCETYPVDVAEIAPVHAAVTAAVAAHGPPDRLVLCAGIAHPDYFASLDDAVFERSMAVNYFGALHVLRSALPAMRARRRGEIVLLSSGAGLVGVFGYAAYAPTKFAVRGLAEVLRAELRHDGIHVAVVFPPDTDTPQLIAENRTKPAETRAISGAARVWSADAVARATLRGLERRRFYITPGWEMTLLGGLHSLLRAPLQAWFDRLADRARAKPAHR